VKRIRISGGKRKTHTKGYEQLVSRSRSSLSLVSFLSFFKRRDGDEDGERERKTTTTKKKRRKKKKRNGGPHNVLHESPEQQQTDTSDNKQDMRHAT
jgi:hypothetical protein